MARLKASESAFWWRRRARGGLSVNYARRQQYRRLTHAGRAGLGSVVAAVLALVIASAGATALAGVLLLAAVGLGLDARRWLSLAGRSRVGARSEDEVQRALAPLRAHGWRLRHSLRWQGRGDIDSVAIVPTGVVVAIETKTRTYDLHHLTRVHEQATWLSRRRRRWSRDGALAILCLVRLRGVERVEHDVLVVSIDRLVSLLRVAAGCAPIRHAPDERTTPPGLARGPSSADARQRRDPPRGPNVDHRIG
jgi:Nuclease-related domain